MLGATHLDNVLTAAVADSSGRGIPSASAICGRASYSLSPKVSAYWPARKSSSPETCLAGDGCALVRV